MESTIDFSDGQIGIGRQGELLTYPNYVFYSCIDTINRLLRIKTGIELNVHAKPFIPMDAKLLCSHCSTKVTIEELHKEQIKQTIKDLKDKIDSTNNDETKDIQSQSTIAEDNQIIEDDWIKVKSNIKTQAVRVVVQQAYIKHLKNRYDALKTVDDDRDEENREEEYNATVQENPKKNQETRESDRMLEMKAKEKYDKKRKTKKRKTKNNVLKTTPSTSGKSNKNGKHDWNEDSYHIKEVSMETIEKERDQHLLKDNKHKTDDDTDSEDDDSSYVSTDSLGLNSNEREEFEVLHRKMNQEEGSEEGSDVSNEIPLVPLQLLDEVEDKLLLSEEKCERLKNEKVVVERQYKDKIDSLEKAIRKKTELLIKALKDKGDTDVRVEKPDKSYQKDFNKVTREILLHEKRIQEEQNKQLINRLQELKNEEEEKLCFNKEQDCEMKKLLYQNDLLLYRLEQAEMKEEKLRNEIKLQNDTKRNEMEGEVISLRKKVQDKEEEWRRKVEDYEFKIETVEKALAAKTKQLINHLRRSD